MFALNTDPAVALNVTVPILSASPVINKLPLLEKVTVPELLLIKLSETDKPPVLIVMAALFTISFADIVRVSNANVPLETVRVPATV